MTLALKDVERRILRLFAQGHSAKSAAAELGLTVHAVNERLRDARRRTGATSSRVLARTLAAQENCDEIVGVAGDDAAVASPPSRDGRTAMVWTGLIGAGVVVAAALPGTPREIARAPVAGPPRVVAIAPATGAVVPAGALTVTVTFDRAMRDDGWSFTSSDRGVYPACAAVPRVAADRRTFTLDCRVERGGRYAIGVNGGGYRNFVGADGIPALPAETRFRAR